MSERTVSLDWTLHEAVERFPELADILYDLGFLGVKNTLMRNTHGRVFTINMGIEKLKIERDRLLATLGEKGFEVK